MPRIQTITLYKFNELPSQIQEFVLERNTNINTDHEWWEIDGLLPECINYDIQSFSIDRKIFIQFGPITINDTFTFRKLLKIPQDLWTKTNYRFFNSRNINTRIILTTDKTFTEEEQDIIIHAECIWDNLVYKVLDNLNSMYQQLISDEGIKETILANEYEYTIKGDLWTD